MRKVSTFKLILLFTRVVSVVNLSQERSEGKARWMGVKKASVGVITIKRKRAARSTKRPKATMERKTERRNNEFLLLEIVTVTRMKAREFLSSPVSSLHH